MVLSSFYFIIATSTSDAEGGRIVSLTLFTHSFCSSGIISCCPILRRKSESISGCLLTVLYVPFSMARGGEQGPATQQAPNVQREGRKGGEGDVERGGEKKEERGKERIRESA